MQEKMTNIEELHLVVELLCKHNLPLSPILEFAIKEREEQYANEANGVAMVREGELFFEVCKELDDYAQEFAKLSVGVVGGKKLPHKAILLIALMNLIENGVMMDNRIPLDKTFVNAFTLCWRRYYNDTKVPSVWTPFWYMKSEPFWHFKSVDDDDLLHGLLAFAGHPSIGQMRSVIKYAYLDKALFGFLENDTCREKLKQVLFKNYIASYS